MTADGYAIEALNRKERGQWFLHHVAGGTEICNLSFSFRTDRQLRWWPLQASLNHLAARHEALRRTFPMIGGVPGVRVAAADGFEVPLVVESATEDTLAAVADRAIAAPFDLAKGPLIRATHILLPGAGVVLVTVHHIVFDAPSATIAARELAQLYECFAEDRPLPPELAGDVPPFREPPPSDEEVAYWAERLAGADASSMALDGARPVTGRPSFAGRTVTVAAPSVPRKLAELRARLKVSDGIAALALSATLLHLCGAGDDLVIGVPVNVRRGRDAALAIGFHISTVPVRFRLTAETTFRDVVAQAREALLHVMANGAVSFEDILERIGHTSADWRIPLFRHLLNIHPGRLPESMPGIPAREFGLYRRHSRADLELSIEGSWADGELQALLSTEAHDEADIVAMLRRFAPLVDATHDNPDVRLADLDVRSAEDRRVIAAVNDTAVPLPELTLLDLFRERAGAAPDRAALVHGDRTWSYGRLDVAAAEVANRLRILGVRPGDRVAVVAERGPWLAAAVLGIWGCGAAYLPIDPSLPRDRVVLMLGDVAGVVVPEGEIPGFVPADDVPFVLVAEADMGSPTVEPPSWPAPGPSPESAAVLIHTSGSTGRPKGIVVGHRAMLNVVSHFADALPFGADDRMLWSTTYAFDVSALELFIPLLQGGRTVVASDEVRRRPADLLRLIAREGVSVVQATPTTWREIVAVPDVDLAGLRVISGGEPLTAALARRLLAAGCRVLNAYGPTETTIWSTAAEITEPIPEPPPVGRPIANTTIEIRDRRGRPCATGLVGELYIGGTGLAEGYHDQPDLTAERFIETPGGRIYRTGDHASLRPDGELVLHGRTDRQVKLRGHRIELGEVEAALERHDEVLAAAVTVADEVLVAFVRTTGEEDPEERLWRHARRLLPPYEVPNRIVVVETFPLTVNGKLDYAAMQAGLVTPEETSSETSSEISDDPLVRDLLEVWREVLDAPRLTASSNFFLNGGHSVLAIRVIAEVEKRLGLELSLEALFAAPTPSDLAARLCGDGVLVSPMPATEERYQ